MLEFDLLDFFPLICVGLYVFFFLACVVFTESSVRKASLSPGQLYNNKYETQRNSS